MPKFLKILRSNWKAFGLYTVLLVFGWFLGERVGQFIIPEMRPMNEPLIHKMIMTSAIIFVVASAIPFVPGAEIGFALLLMFGGPIAPLVYGCMVCALILAYTIARTLPAALLANGMRRLGLNRAGHFVDTMNATPKQHRIKHLTEHLPGGFPKRLLRYRYLALFAIINLPGNSVVGGGGGIAFAAGASGLFGTAGFLMTVLLAVAPIPLFFFLFQYG